MTSRKPKPTAPDPAASEKEWPPIDPATICPTKTVNGVTFPDGYNHAFSRNVSRAEALARGWKYCQPGDSCRQGHIAPRPVSNPYACVSCHRIKRGLPPIGAVARHQRFNAPGAGRPPANAPAAAPAPAPSAPREPDARDRRFLSALAELRDLDRACAAVGVTRPGIDARLSYDQAFRDAVRDLCERMLIQWTLPPAPSAFEWTEQSREQFIQVFIDTGDIQTARESVGATPSSYFAELEINRGFEAAVEKAKPLAAAALEDRAVGLALGGNSKLLERLLAAKKPDEYGDRLRIDVHSDNLRKLSDEQIKARILSTLPDLAARFGFRLVPIGQVVDAVVEPIDAGAKARSLEAPGGKRDAPRAREDAARTPAEDTESTPVDPTERSILDLI